MLQEGIIAVLISLGVIPMTMMLTTIVVHIPKYSQYKKTYEALSTWQYQLVLESAEEELIRFSHREVPEKWWRDDEEIIFFDYGKGSIKLVSGPGKRNGYIHESLLTYLDPYTFYWYWKIHRWWKKNKNFIIHQEITWEG